jgi:outer membrane protein assembly factor BamB
MQRRDPARTGHAPEQAGPTENPTVRWTASPADDRSTWSWVVGTAETVYTATDRSIHAFDAATGERRWRTDSIGTLPWSDRGTRVETGPALAEDRLLVGASVSQYALDPDDGRAAWQYETNSSLAASLLAGNTAYVSSLVGTGDRLVALDARSGLERWRTRPDTGVHPNAYTDGHVVGPTIDGDGAVGAVDAATGETTWTRDLPFHRGYWLLAGFCIADGTVYVGTEPVYALGLEDGATRWSASLGAADAESRPVSDGSRVYLAAGEAGRVLALDAATGEEAWRVAVPDAVGWGAPALAGGTLYVGIEGGVLALDAATGEERFRVRKPERAGLANSPVVAGGTLYLLLGRTLYALGGSDP